MNTETGIRANIKNNLSHILSEQNISQTELARRLNVSPAAVNNWLMGRGSPTLEVIMQICSILDIDPSYFLGFNKEAISSDEINLILSYREHPEYHPAIHKMLDLAPSPEFEELTKWDIDYQKSSK